MLAIGTRFSGVDPENDLPHLGRFIQAASHLGKVFVAINGEEDKTNALEFVKKYGADLGVESFYVTPWGKFVPALNALVYKASIGGAKYLLLASVEFPPQGKWVRALLKYIDDTTLVVGARFAEHKFQNEGGIVSGNGSNIPWNTFALWNLSLLSKVGFILVGDAPFDPSMAGVEELSTMALFQKIFPPSEVKLVDIIDFPREWNVEGWSEARKAQHLKKITSRKTRGAAQLRWLGLPPPIVHHIKDH